jgi:carbon storage regulator
MLVLSRKKKQRIVIKGNITVTVLEIRGGKVRLGIIAPRDIPVHRLEVHRIIQQQAEAQRSPEPCVGIAEKG